MKNTLIAPLPPIKSISPYCLNLARELAKKVELQVIGFKSIIPEVFYSGGSVEKETAFRGIPNVKIQNIINWYNPFTWIIASLKAEGDIVHIQHWATYSSIFYCIMMPVLKIRNKKIVITIHNITPHMTNKWFVFADKIVNKMIFPFASVFIVHNQRNKDKLMNLYIMNEENIFIISHGAMLPEIMQNISKKKARESLGIPIKNKSLLFFGYIWRYKGLDTLLYAFNLVHKDIPESTLLIAGELVHGSKEWNEYEKIIQTYSLQPFILKKIEYIPESEIEIYFSASDLVVLPYQEPFDTHGGIAALAIAFKKPLVVTDIGGSPEYVKDTRVISKPNDAEGLAKNIIRVLQDKQLYAKLSKDSKERAQELTWDTIAQKTVSIYQNLMNKKD